jgi:hypothetical protein
MRWKLLLAFGGLTALLMCVVIVACSGSSCKQGTLLLHVALLDDSPLADHITVVGNDPGAAIAQTIAHVPNQAAADQRVEHVALEVVWPGGYPVYAEVHLTVSAFSGDTLLGNNTVTVRLEPGCSETSTLVSARGFIPDGGATD